MDHFEVAARGAYICFWSARGKLIIVKHLWACYMEKAQYKCTTLLFYFNIASLLLSVKSSCICTQLTWLVNDYVSDCLSETVTILL